MCVCVCVCVCACVRARMCASKNDFFSFSCLSKERKIKNFKMNRSTNRFLFF